MNSQRILVGLATCAATVLLIGCDNDNPQEPEPSNLPPADGAALVSFLNSENYQDDWALWPGRGELYEGTEPHGMLLTTYVNDVARQALAAGNVVMPNGAIVVKENYMPDGTLAAITTMFKVQDFNPAANDWFWLSHGPDGSIEVEGAVEMCVSCHSGAANFDYLWLSQQDASQ